MQILQKKIFRIGLLVFGFFLFSTNVFAADGVCGSANGTTITGSDMAASTPPASALCVPTQATAVALNGSNYTWTCPADAGGGADASCSAAFVSDTTAPIISGQYSTITGNTTATIGFNTSESATCEWHVASGIPYLGVYNTGLAYPFGTGIAHSIDITSLLPGTTYSYYIKCADAAGNISNEASITFTMSFSAAATPTATPIGGTYSTTQLVTLLTATSGATIYYTIDGSTPTNSSFLYTTGSSLSVGSTRTIKAIAVKSGMSDSAVMTENYIINNGSVATPVASPAAGTYSSTQTVTLSSATPGATIYITLDGSNPLSSPTASQYSSPLTISASKTIKAVAQKSGMANSNIMTQTYVIGSGSVAPVFNSATSGINPTSTGVGSTYTITCDYGKQSSVIKAYNTAASGLPWIECARTTGVWNGTVMSFTCNAGTNIGSLRNTCYIGSEGTYAASTDNLANISVTAATNTNTPTATFNSFTTSDTTPGISGTYTGTPVAILIYAGSYYYPAVVNGNGTWTLADNTITPALSNGTHSIRVKAVDASGNNSSNYINIVISDGSVSGSGGGSTTNDNNSSKKSKPAKQIKNSEKVVNNGDIMVQSGKNFPKNSKVLLYFQRSNGSFYPPKFVTTDSKGKFSIRYKINKPSGVYNWFAQDYRSGKKVWSKYRVQ